jgi:hypothetical protein
VKAKASILIPSLTLAMACAGGEADQAATTLPDAIHGLQRVEVQSGDEAAEMIGGMHGRRVAPTNSQVAYYGPEDMRAVLYVSEFESDEAAQEQLNAMAAGIGEGTAEYGHHNQFEVEGRQIHSVFGEGQIHYFYTDGTDLVWVSLPTVIARPGLAEVLKVEASSIPPLGPVGG